VVAEVIQREKTSLQDLWKGSSMTKREDIEIVKVAMEAEKDAFQAYSKLPRRRPILRGGYVQQLSEFEMNHYRKLKDLLTSLQEKENGSFTGGHLLREDHSLEDAKAQRPGAVDGHGRSENRHSREKKHRPTTDPCWVDPRTPGKGYV